MNKTILKRFLRGFIAGGVAQITVMLQTGVTVHDLADLKNLGTVVLTAFFVGGFLGLDKLLRYEDESPEEIPTES